MFSVEEYLYQTAAMGAAARSAARAGQLARGAAVDGNPGVEPQQLPGILPDELTARYPQFANSLLNLLRNAEKTLSE
jgi:hypothetical protein